MIVSGDQTVVSPKTWRVALALQYKTFTAIRNCTTTPHLWEISNRLAANAATASPCLSYRNDAKTLHRGSWTDGERSTSK